MDAANYINTLDSLALTETSPTAPQFAIVDLAVDDGFLGQLYDGMKQATIDWFSLFIGSAWQPDWAHGPILVNLTTSPDFASELVPRMEARPLGVMIHSDVSNTEMLQRCQHWLFNNDNKRASLLRFYDPRMMTPLMAALKNQRVQLIGAGELWSWHNGHQWQQYQSTSDSAAVGDQVPHVTTEQLNSVPWYRLAVHAREYAEHYCNSLLSHPDPQIWVMNCLIQARESGFKTKADQERWLRLAIENGDTCYKQDTFRKVMEQRALTPAEQLTAMESNSESVNASV